MKIEMYYDPIKPETFVKIDGILTDKSDIYGFLYPVRHCLLQSWLNENGSWNGLKKQIEMLARKEEAELTFYGRKSDGIDLSAIFSGSTQFKISYCQIDILEMYEKILSDSIEMINEILDRKTPMEYDGADTTYRTATELFPDMYAEIKQFLMADKDYIWLNEVSNENDFNVAISGFGDCIMLKEPFISSFENLHRTNELTASMRRADNMIWCVLSSQQKTEELKEYAEQFPDLHINFTVDSIEWKNLLFEKYGKPFLLRKKLSCVESAVHILDQYFDKHNKIKKEQIELQHECDKGSPSVEVIRRYRTVSFQQCWLNANKLRFQKLKTMLEHNISNLIDERKEQVSYVN